MPYRITVTPEVANLRANQTGTRNVKVGTGHEAVVHTFTRQPVYMDEVPDEIKNDPHLVVTRERAKAEPVAAPPPAPEPESENADAEPEVAEVEPAPAPRKRGRPAKKGRK